MRLFILSTLLCFTCGLSAQVLNSDIRLVWRIEAATANFTSEAGVNEYTWLFGINNSVGPISDYDLCVTLDSETGGTTTDFSQVFTFVEEWGYTDEFHMHTQAWEDDEGDRCAFDQGDDQIYFGWSTISGGTIPETSGPSRNATNNNASCFGQELVPATEFWDFCYALTWRHIAGDELNDPLILNSNFSSSAKFHLNSNLDLEDVGNALKYSDTYGDASPDVFYRINLNDDYSTVTFSTDNEETDFDTKIYLLDANGVQIAENDDVSQENTKSFLSLALCEGSYTLVVEGFGNETGDFRIDVDANGFVGPLETVTTLTNATCEDANDGSVTANANFGVPPYTYNLYGPDGLSLPFADGVFSELEAGSFYFYTVTDACGEMIDSENFTVGVTDTIAPTANCIGVIVPINEDEVDRPFTTEELEFLASNSSDNCGDIALVEVFPSTISASDGPVVDYELTVYDETGNASSALCQLTLEVVSSVQQHADLDAALTAYPNPVNDRLTVNIAGYAIGEGQLFLRDQQGRIVLQKMIGNRPADWSENLSVGHLSAGLYTLQLVTKEGQLTRKIVKQ